MWLMGSSRNQGDDARIQGLRKLCIQYDVEVGPRARREGVSADATLRRTFANSSSTRPFRKLSSDWVRLLWV